MKGLKMANFIGQGALLSVVSKRAMREVFGMALSGALALYANNPWFLAAKPLLATLGKWGREKYGNTFWTAFPF
jgi:hypothetical protein